MKPFIVYHPWFDDQLFLYIPIAESADPSKIADFIQSAPSIRKVYQFDVFKYKEEHCMVKKSLILYRVECNDIKNNLQRIEDMINDISIPKEE